MFNRITWFFLSLLLFSSVFSHENANGHIHLTDEEKAWVENHPVIRVANEMDWPPFDFNEYNKPKGLAIDHIKLLAKKIGIKIEFVNGYSWAELLELFKKHKIDVMPVIYRNNEREKFTLFTQPYYRGKLGIFTNNEARTWDNSLLNKRVGIEKSHGSIPIVKKRNPGINLIEVPSIVDLLMDLATHKVDAIIGNPLVFYYYAKENQLKNLELSDFVQMNKEEQLKTSLHIGVRKDWPLLQQILQKSMYDVSDDEMENIESKWTDIIIVRNIDWALVTQIVAAISLILLFLAWHNRKLSSMVDQKTIELQQLNNDLEKKVASRTKELSELNYELKNIANTDPLTGAYNRRYFFDISNNIISLANRDKKPLALAMIDIDKFKNINDTYGHDVGDKVLQLFVKDISNNIRSGDIMARFGGEEFIVLFPNTDIEGAARISEKIRNIIENSATEENISYSISIGVSSYIKEEKDINSTITRADKALYKAKQDGRNQVQIYI